MQAVKTTPHINYRKGATFVPGIGSRKETVIVQRSRDKGAFLNWPTEESDLCAQDLTA